MNQSEDQQTMNGESLRKVSGLNGWIIRIRNTSITGQVRRIQKVNDNDLETGLEIKKL